MSDFLNKLSDALPARARKIIVKQEKEEKKLADPVLVTVPPPGVDLSALWEEPKEENSMLLPLILSGVGAFCAFMTLIVLVAFK